MPQTLLLLLCSGLSSLCLAQQTDTVKLFYNTDAYHLPKDSNLTLDAFLKHTWDYISIRSYTDETDGDDYNMNLSKRRGEEVYRYFIARNIAANNLKLQYFGEAAPLSDNSTEEGRAFNRQTTIIGYRYPRIKPKSVTNPLQPVTTTLNNGFIITYRPGTVPQSLLEYFEAGTAPFQLVTNTTEMRQAGLYTNTTRGDILSSVIVFCGQGVTPCNIDSPVLVKVPIPFQTNCPLEKIQFYNTVAERGKLLWQEQSRQLYPEVIGGRQYLSVWLDNFCECINFDIKIPDCYEVDSAQLLVKTKVKSLTTELTGLNSVYIPRKLNDSTHSVMYKKSKPDEALISFSAYNGKRYVKRFTNKPLNLLPYNESEKSYTVSLDSVSFYLPNLKGYDMAIKVSGDRYRTYLENDRCQFLYVKRKDEVITVDLWVPSRKGKNLEYRNQPLSSIPFDTIKQCYVIDKSFLKELELKKTVTKR